LDILIILIRKINVMNIGMILDNEFTGDLRVENEVSALRSAGFNVFVLCLNYGNKPEEESFHNAKIIRISASKSIVKKLRALTNTFFDFYTSFWANKINAFVNKYKIDVLHVHDLYMFGSAFRDKKLNKSSVKIIGDLHENYVEGLRHYKFSTTFPGNILISIKKWERTEVEWINKLDAAITVIEEAVERYSSIGIDKNKFTVVPNYVNQSEFLESSVDPNIVQRFRHFNTVTYIGAFDLHRGLESIIRSVPEILNHIDNFKLVFVGHGKNFSSLNELANKLNVSKYVLFEGWQPVSKFSSYIAASSACVIPHLKTIHTDNTIPHKLFQYMIMSKPVIATNCNPIVRIVTDEKCGVIYESGNSQDFSQKVISLFSNSDLMNELGRNGRIAVESKYNWTNAANNLINLYKTM